MKRVITAAANIPRNTSNPRYGEYDAYLNQHITGVWRSWIEILKPAMLDADKYDISEILSFDDVISKHDSSKYEYDEYNPYCNYFYPCEGHKKDSKAFDLAWLLHQHRNPHHHQYWVLIRDEGEKEPMDMPLVYICEMLCDWHSFTLRDPESTALKWWEDNQDKMVLSNKTISTINQLIKYMDKPLDYVAEPDEE